MKNTNGMREDHVMKENKRVDAVVRYTDRLLIFRRRSPTYMSGPQCCYKIKFSQCYNLDHCL